MALNTPTFTAQAAFFTRSHAQWLVSARSWARFGDAAGAVRCIESAAFARRQLVVCLHEARREALAGSPCPRCGLDPIAAQWCTECRGDGR